MTPAADTPYGVPIEVDGYPREWSRAAIAMAINRRVVYC